MPVRIAREKKIPAIRGRYCGRDGASGENSSARSTSQQKQAAKKK